MSLLVYAFLTDVVSPRTFGLGAALLMFGLFIAFAFQSKAAQPTKRSQDSVSPVSTDSRIRATFSFVASGGLLILLAPYLIHEAITRNIPWPVTVVAIPIYALLSYGAFKLYWPRIVSRRGKSAHGSTTPGEQGQKSL